MILGLGFFTAESLIADVCDGDSGLARVTSIGGAAQTDSSDSPAPTPGHTLHVCHCIHAHGGTPALILGGRAAPATAFTVTSFAELTPPSPALEPQLRPPIA